MATLSQLPSLVPIHSSSDLDIGRISFLNHIKSHANNVKETADRAVQLGAEAEQTAAAAAYFEERALQLFEARRELEAATQAIKSREQYLLTRYGGNKSLNDTPVQPAITHNLANSSQHREIHLTDESPSGDSTLEYYTEEDIESDRQADSTTLQRQIVHLQSQLATVQLQHSKSVSRNTRHQRELGNLRTVASDGKAYKQESLALQKQLEHERQKSSALRYEVARLQGKVEGLRDKELKTLREEKDAAVQQTKAPKVFIRQKDLQGFYKQVSKWVAPSTSDTRSHSRSSLRPAAITTGAPRHSEDDRPLILTSTTARSQNDKDDIELHDLSDLSSPHSADQDFALSTLSSPISHSYNPSTLLKRTRSKLGSKSSRLGARPARSHSHAKPSSTNPATTAHANADANKSAPRIPLPLFAPPLPTTCVKINISSQTEIAHSILSPWIVRTFFSDPRKMAEHLDLAQAWQKDWHQSPKCLVVACRRKGAGLWSAKDRREGRSCGNCCSSDMEVGGMVGFVPAPPPSFDTGAGASSNFAGEKAGTKDKGKGGKTVARPVGPTAVADEITAESSIAGGSSGNGKETWPPGSGPPQCLKLISRTQLELLNPRPWDWERQEIFDRANEARRAGKGEVEARGIEMEMGTLGRERSSGLYFF